MWHSFYFSFVFWPIQMDFINANQCIFIYFFLFWWLVILNHHVVKFVVSPVSFIQILIYYFVEVLLITFKQHQFVNFCSTIWYITLAHIYIYIYIQSWEKIQLNLKLKSNYMLCVPFNFLNFGATIYCTTKIVYKKSPGKGIFNFLC